MGRVRYLGVLGLILSLLPIPGASAELPFPGPSNRAEMHGTFQMDAGADSMLRRNGFVVLDGISRDNLQQAYPGDRKEQLPLFVTSDALLAFWYQLSRSLVSDVEQRSLYPELSAAVASLHRTGERLRSTARSAGEKRDFHDAVLSLAVADRLLGGKGGDEPEVSSLVAKVLAAKEVSAYPGEDFTQYRVRSHYANSPALGRYFRGSMWLSRRVLAADTAASQGDRPLREAIALAAILRADRPAQARLAKVAAARQFLAGAPNAIAAQRLLAALERIHGPRWQLAAAATPDGLARLRRELAKPAYPAARVWTRPTAAGTRFPGKVIALLPDAAVPDSRLFQETMHPALPGRVLPSPLEVGAGLGFAVARGELKGTDTRATEVLLRVDRAGPLGKGDTTTLYGGWLAALRTLTQPDRRAPRFMQTGAWGYKSLNTSLASWAQLRHTTQLYTAQAYGGTLGMSFTPPEALVEPVPGCYRALESLARRTRSTLAGGISSRNTADLQSFELKCRELAALADTELATGTLTPQQAHSLAEFGHWLERFQLLGEPTVADVATGSRGEVLHAATGSFHPILIIPDPAHPVAYCGWVMSYYEATRPRYSRLTDAEWKGMLAGSTLLPERPAWTAHFVAPAVGAHAAVREPLRRAEALFRQKQPEQALAVLRALVEAQRASPIGTEAQLRIGRYYLEQRQYRKAAAELARCERLYGCEAVRVARGLREEAEYAASERQPKTRAEYDSRIQRMRAKIAAVARLAASPSRRAAEELLVRELLGSREVGDDPRLPWLVREARAACRSEDLRQFLAYAALGVRGRHEQYGFTEGDLVDDCLAFSRGPAPAALRAGSVAIASEAGLKRRDPDRALDLLRKVRHADLLLPPALAKLLPHDITLLELDPAKLVPEAHRQALTISALAAFRRGDWHRLSVCDAELRSTPGLETTDTVLTETRLLFARFGEQDLTPLRRFVAANSQEVRGGPSPSGVALLQLDRDYPRAAIRPFALWRAREAFTRAANARLAEAAGDVLLRHFSNSYPAGLVRAERAMAQWDVAAMRIASERLEKETEFSHGSYYLRLPEASSFLSDLRARQAAAERVRAVLAPGQSPAVLEELARHPEPAALENAVARLFPHITPEQYLLLLSVDEFRGLAKPFLRRYPDHPRANEAWEKLTLTSFEYDLPWLAALVERGPSYRWERQAAARMAWIVGGDGYPDDEQAESYFRWSREQASTVRRTYPGSRVAAVADTAVALALLRKGWPEAALEVLGLQPALSPDDPARFDWEELHQRALLEVAGKGKGAWEPRWSTKLSLLGAIGGGPGISEKRPAAPLLAGRLLMIPVTLGREAYGIAALDEATGAVAWKAPTGFPRTLAADGARQIFVGTDQGKIIALSPGGEVVYEKKLSHPDAGVLAAADGILVIWDGAELQGLIAASGERRWSRRWTPLAGRPATSGGRIFLIEGPGKVTAVELATGKAAWTREFRTPADGALIRGLPGIDGGIVTLRVADRIELLDEADGHTLAEYRRQGLEETIAGSMQGYEAVELVAGAAPSTGVLIGRDRTTYLLRRGTAIFARDFSDVVVRDGLVYGSDEHGRATAWELQTGARLTWSDPVTGGPPLVVGQHVYYFKGEEQVLALPRVTLPELPSRP